MKYKVLLFDLDETLFDFKKSEKYAFFKSLQHYKIGCNNEKTFDQYKEINKNLWIDLEKGLISLDELRLERFKILLKNINVDENYKIFSDTYEEFLGQASFVFPEAEDIIKFLSEKYKLVIITNGIPSVQRTRINKSNLGKYFESIIISGEVGVSKPNIKIFNAALNSINFEDKSKALMVGDSLTSDIYGGFMSGIDTCWYNPNEKKNSSNINPSYEINTLLQLYDIL